MNTALANQAVVDELVSPLETQNKSWEAIDIADISKLEAGDIIRMQTSPGNIYLLEVAFPATRLAHIYRHEKRGYAMQGYRGARIIVFLKVGRMMLYTASDNPEDATDIRKLHRTSVVKNIHLLHA